MPHITALEPQHDPERVNVFLDGAFAFGASLLVASAHGWQVGREVDDAAIEALRRDEEVERTYGAALNFLSFRARSRREVEVYLRRRGTEPNTADAVLARLDRLALTDDRAFARFWVENRQQFRPRGARALRAELRQKGLESDVIADALEESLDEESAARSAGAKKVRSLASLDDREYLRRMVGYLQRRGFAYELAARVARELRSVDQDEDSP